MNKQMIIDLLTKNYTSFVDHINGLTNEEFLFRYEEKWTAGQQLEHMVLCTKPILYVYSMDKATIEQNFGKTDRPGNTYEFLFNDYKEKIKAGGKAPDRFVPPAVLTEQKEILGETLKKLIQELCLKIETFTDPELDTLLIPHPLLGNLTLREMMYNAIQHVEHHHGSVKQNLTHK